MRSEEFWTASPQCQRKAQAALPNPTQTNLQTLNSELRVEKNGNAKRSLDAQNPLFLVQTSTCNFILESLWIPGTSILRYSIYRLNYESKTLSVCEDTVCTTEPLHISALGCVCLPFCRTMTNNQCRRVLIMAGRLPFELLFMLKPRGPREDPFYCILYSYLDCRRGWWSMRMCQATSELPSICVYL